MQKCSFALAQYQKPEINEAYRGTVTVVLVLTAPRFFLIASRVALVTEKKNLIGR